MPNLDYKKALASLCLRASSCLIATKFSTHPGGEETRLYFSCTPPHKVIRTSHVSIPTDHGSRIQWIMIPTASVVLDNFLETWGQYVSRWGWKTCQTWEWKLWRHIGLIHLGPNVESKGADERVTNSALMKM